MIDLYLKIGAALALLVGGLLVIFPDDIMTIYRGIGLAIVGLGLYVASKTFEASK
jgi:hypothetical protein